MGRVVELTDPGRIERFARRDLPLHLYELGDLDPAFWPRTRWWGLDDADVRDELCALALLYDGSNPATLLVLGRHDGGAARELLAALADRLPPVVYAHLSPGIIDGARARFTVEPRGPHLKMVLRQLSPADDGDVVSLGDADLPELHALYERAYPGNWFDPAMVRTGQYVGIRDDGALVCVAGVHVFSPVHRVAAIGNVATDPAKRGRGLARRATAGLCRSLDRAGIADIGLNVHADNAAAIRCYEQIGFVVAAEYDELVLIRR